MSTSNITMWAEDRKYTGGDLTVLRDGAHTPAIGDEGIALNRISVQQNSYIALVDVGLFGLYGRALTDQEVLQNYESLRGRYGI